MRPQLSGRAIALRQVLLNAPVKFEHQLIHKPTSTQLQAQQPHALNCRRSFSQSSPLLKKKGKEERARGPDNAATKAPEVEDPFDFSAMEAEIDKARRKLSEVLSKLNSRGRFNPGIVEDIRVELVDGGKKSARLGDLAQVVPKGGRTLMILCGDKPLLKAITTSIHRNVPYLSPQPDPVNPLQLNMRVPMPTRESRDEALKAASKAGDIASLAVKAARATTQKRLRAMELKKAVRPDDLRKAHVKMEEIVQKATADAKREVEDTRKLMDRPAPNP